MASDQPKKAALALSGVRVLALEVSVAGPHATRILGDMGAEVIKLEKLGTGDLIRQWDSAVHGLSSGFVWLTVISEVSRWTSRRKPVSKFSAAWPIEWMSFWKTLLRAWPIEWVSARRNCVRAIRA